MITLEQAIDLATQAHKGQWRNPTVLDKTSNIYNFLQNNRTINDNNGWTIYLNECKYVLQDNNFLEYKPYITHPLAVMEMMDTEEEKILAVLHDVLEHNKQFRFPIGHKPYSPENSKMAQKIWAGLHVLTKEKRDSYDKYIHYISLNKLATKVKIADIVHNLSCSPSEHAKQKYLKALAILLKSI